MTDPIASDPDPMQLTPTQIDNYLARRVDVPVPKYGDPIAEPFHGQGTNDSETEKHSNDAINRGSVRAEGNVNNAHTTL